jgi:hypothetical protein
VTFSTSPASLLLEPFESRPPQSQPFLKFGLPEYLRRVMIVMLDLSLFTFDFDFDWLSYAVFSVIGLTIAILKLLGTFHKRFKVQRFKTTLNPEFFCRKAFSRSLSHRVDQLTLPRKV